MKTVYDTCLYIDLLRAGERLSLFTDRTHLRYLSPIVMMELRAGARTPTQRRIIDRLVAPYSKAKRIIHLNSNLYYKAGEFLARLDSRKLRQSRFLVNDLLIALSAASIGATLYTNDRKDFEQISSIVPISVVYI